MISTGPGGPRADAQPVRALVAVEESRGSADANHEGTGLSGALGQILESRSHSDDQTIGAACSSTSTASAPATLRSFPPSRPPRRAPTPRRSMSSSSARLCRHRSRRAVGRNPRYHHTCHRTAQWFVGNRLCRRCRLPHRRNVRCLRIGPEARPRSLLGQRDDVLGPRSCGFEQNSADWTHR